MTQRVTFEDICAQRDLTVVENLPVADGGAEFLAHVLDGAGVHRLLKRNSGLRGHGEITLLQTWAATGVVLPIIEVIDEDTFLGEWIDGTTLEQSDRPLESLLRQCGAALRLLHGARPPALPLMSTRERTSGEWLARDLLGLPEPWMRARATEAAAALGEYENADTVVLHGDVVPGNLLVSGDRLVVIDPIGFSGPPGSDLAQLAIALEGTDRRANLDPLLDGYGKEAGNIEAAFAYLAFMFLSGMSRRELAAPGTHAHVVAELASLVASFR